MPDRFEYAQGARFPEFLWLHMLFQLVSMRVPRMAPPHASLRCCAAMQTPASRAPGDVCVGMFQLQQWSRFPFSDILNYGPPLLLRLVD